MRAPQFALSGTGILALAGLAGLGLVGAWLYVKKGGLAGAAQAIGGAAVAAADGAVSGVVKGAGELVGIPDTSSSECDKALREGRTWDASFACPAGRFIGGLVRPETVDTSVLDANDARARKSAVVPVWHWPTLDPNDTSTWAAP